MVYFCKDMYMTKRKEAFITGNYYHIYNRSVGKEQIFYHKADLNYFFHLLQYYRYKQQLRYSLFNELLPNQKLEYINSTKTFIPLVEINCFSLMPNHFHFLLKQVEDNGIQIFLTKIENSFAHYYDLHYGRVGSVFQNNFKGKKIDNNEIILHISRYIHLNHITSNLLSWQYLLYYPYSSLIDYYLKPRNFVSVKTILSSFRDQKEYIKFVHSQREYQRKLHLIKKYLLEK